MNSTVRLSVVICAYNEEDWIGKTLDSLAMQHHQSDEIVVVDNNSTDNTAQVIKDFADHHSDIKVTYIFEPEQGLHHAREAGWRATSGGIIAMTDADIMFPPDWTQIIMETFADPDIHAITGIVRYHDAPFFINLATWATDQLYQPEGIGKLMTDEYVLNGGNSAYRRNVLEAVNGYLDKPYGELEDRYMSRQIKEGSYNIKFVRHLKVWHTFRRFSQDGWRGYMNYLFFYTAENVYPDHISQE